MKKHIPWVEKYRPTKLSDVVLDSTNKKILDNILKQIISLIYFFMGHLEQGKQQLLLT